MTGGASEEMTEYRTMPRVPKAMANKIYAVTKAPFPKTLRPHCQAALQTTSNGLGRAGCSVLRISSG
jgi:hypothetical protein